MGSRNQSKRAQLEQLLAARTPPVITEEIWRELRTALEPVSESHLRRLVRATGVPLAPLVEGIRQDSFEDLERTLAAVAAEYEAAVAAQDRERTRACRQPILTAKDHARLAGRSAKASPEKRAQKEEMILWMTVWLENPAVFATWLELRKRATEARSPEP